MEDLKTPTEIIKMFPDCGYCARDIGYLLMLKAVKGMKITNGCLISVTSFMAFTDYRKENDLQKY